MLGALDVAHPVGAHEVAAHRLEGGVDVAEHRVGVVLLPQVVDHVPLLDVGLQGVAVGVLERRLPEPVGAQLHDPRQEIRPAVVQATPRHPDGFELSQRLVGLDQLGPHGVREAAGLRPQLQPEGVTVEGCAVEHGQFHPEILDGRSQFRLAVARQLQPLQEARRPGVVDELDDLRLLHEVVDELGGHLAAALADRLVDLRDRADRLVGPVTGSDTLSELVRPREMRHGTASPRPSAGSRRSLATERIPGPRQSECSGDVANRDGTSTFVAPEPEPAGRA